MDLDDARKIIELLADGVDPYTGEVFPVDSPYQRPQTIRALFMALRALDREKIRKKRATSLPYNAGNPWTDEEDQHVISAFDAGARVEDLAKAHGRTIRAITSRLEKLGKIQPNRGRLDAS